MLQALSSKLDSTSVSPKLKDGCLLVLSCRLGGQAGNLWYLLENVRGPRLSWCLLLCNPVLPYGVPCCRSSYVDIPGHVDCPRSPSLYPAMPLLMTLMSMSMSMLMPMLMTDRSFRR